MMRRFVRRGALRGRAAGAPRSRREEETILIGEEDRALVTHCAEMDPRVCSHLVERDARLLAPMELLEHPVEVALRERLRRAERPRRAGGHNGPRRRSPHAKRAEVIKRKSERDAERETRRTPTTRDRGDATWRQERAARSHARTGHPRASRVTRHTASRAPRPRAKRGHGRRGRALVSRQCTTGDALDQRMPLLQSKGSLNKTATSICCLSWKKEKDGKKKRRAPFRARGRRA